MSIQLCLHYDLSLIEPERCLLASAVKIVSVDSTPVAGCYLTADGWAGRKRVRWTKFNATEQCVDVGVGHEVFKSQSAFRAALHRCEECGWTVRRYRE